MCVACISEPPLASLPTSMKISYMAYIHGLKPPDHSLPPTHQHLSLTLLLPRPDWVQSTPSKNNAIDEPPNTEFPEFVVLCFPLFPSLHLFVADRKLFNLKPLSITLSSSSIDAGRGVVRIRVVV